MTPEQAIERLQRNYDNRNWTFLHEDWYALREVLNQARELSALKAKVERLKHHVEHYCGECQEEILAILDGKEG